MASIRAGVSNMADTSDPQKYAKFMIDADRELKMELLRQGSPRLGAFDADQLIQEECAKGDARNRAKWAAEEKASRERGARLRAGRP
jgi:hypothetical protein